MLKKLSSTKNISFKQLLWGLTTDICLAVQCGRCSCSNIEPPSEAQVAGHIISWPRQKVLPIISTVKP